MSKHPESRVPRPRRFQFTILSLLIAMTVIAVAIVLWKYQVQRRATVRRTYDEQKKVADQVVEDFIDSIEREGQVWISKHTEGANGSGEWRLSFQLIAHKRLYKVGEQAEEEICRCEFKGVVSQDASGLPTWWSNLPLEITCGGGSEEERFVEFLTERLRAKQWKYVIEKKDLTSQP